jgi:hypothetical protein
MSIASGIVNGTTASLVSGITSGSGGVANMLIIGQSNASKLTSDFSGAGEVAIKAAFSSLGRTLNVVNSGVPGSAVHRLANETFGFWWDDLTSAPSTPLTNAIAAVTAASIPATSLDVIFYVNGETDSVNISDATITEAQFKSSFKAMIDYLKGIYPNAKHVIVPLGADTTSNTNYDGGWRVRRAQWELWNQEANVFEAPGFMDLTASDDTHLDSAGYTTMGTRIGRRAAAVLGLRSTVGTLGPIPVSAIADVSENQVRVTITHDGGNDFMATAVADADNFILASAFVNATTMRFGSYFVKTNATEYRYRLASHTIIITDTIVCHWPYGAGHGITRTEFPLDNNGLPLRPNYNITATVQA